jgi:proteasome accessory factor B
LEVSRQTVKRDVEFMKERMGLPVEYDGRRWGYFYSRPVDRLPGAGMSEAELFALRVARKAFAPYRGTPFEPPLKTAFEKLTGQTDARDRGQLAGLEQGLSFRPFAPEDADAAAFQVINRAMRERRILKFRYRNLGARHWQPRRARPYHVACIDSHWYLFAHDEARAAVRTFALARLADPALAAERFQRPASFDPDEYLRGSFTVMKGQEDYAVVIEFDAWATDLVRGRQWHDSQTLAEMPGGGSQLRMRLSGLSEVERWVLTWGDHATVIQPRALEERVREIAKALVAKYAAFSGGDDPPAQ